MKGEFSILRGGRGCDFVVALPEGRVGTDIKLLQLTDTQIIDSSQRRVPNRIPADKIAAWSPENFDAQCGNHIRALVNSTRPDMIFITGDVVYGEFDDDGSALRWFIGLMDSFEIPWAPVFGNHDNESKIGVRAQCEMLESSKYCLFRRGDVSGNGNYTVGVSVGGELVRVLYMLDSNGCTNTADPEVIRKKVICPNQLDFVEESSKEIASEAGRVVPGFMAFHIPPSIFVEAEREKGYVTDDRRYYTIGVDVEARDDDFGFMQENAQLIECEADMLDFTARVGVDAIFVGHHHSMSSVIRYHHLRLVYGLKTGQYDTYIPGSVGGTLVTLRGEKFDVAHVPSLCPYGPVPESAERYVGFFLKA